MEGAPFPWGINKQIICRNEINKRGYLCCDTSACKDPRLTNQTLPIISLLLAKITLLHDIYLILNGISANKHFHICEMTNPERRNT